MTRAFGLLATVASLTFSGSLMAQGAMKSAATAEAPPQVTIKAVSAVTSLSNWPGLSLSVDKDAYVTVFAVTRTNGSALPIQVLSPARPNSAGRIKAGKSVTPRLLLGDEALHLLSYGESPLIVAFASTVKPELSAFQAGGRWGRDLLMDTLAGNDQQMVEILAKTIYAAGVPFDAVVSAPSTIPSARTVAGGFDFRDTPIEVTAFGQRVGAPILEKVDPEIMTADVYQQTGMLPNVAYNGAPFTLKGGMKVSITRAVDGNGYRLTYWGKENRPPTADQKAGQAGAGSSTSPPVR